MADNLTRIFAPNGTPFTVGSQYADRFTKLLKALGDRGVVPMANQSGGFNPRYIAGTRTPSQHAFGRAIDINWTDNPRGGAGKIDPAVARDVAAQNGFTWGGDWKNPDPMHFEIASGTAAGAPMGLGGPKPQEIAAAMPTNTGTPIPAVMSPNDVQRRRKLAEALISQGTDTSPVGSWTQAVARVLQGAVGGIQMDQANQAEQEGQSSGSKALAQALLGGGDVGPALANPYVAEQALPIAMAQYKQNMDAPQRELENRKTEAEIRALEAKQDDPVQALLLEKLRGRDQAQPAAGIQPQSNTGVAVPQTGLINVADQTEAPPPPTPQPEAGAPMVETPFGQMSEKDARDLAGPMLLNPKYAAAGKAILDSINAGGQGALAKPTVNQLEERTMNAASQLARIGDIKKRFQAQFLQVPTRMQMLANSWTAKAGGKLSPDQQKSLSDYAGFRSSAVNNLNTILKELSGAAVTPQEYERIQNDVPTAGTGIFDGDDPTSFKSKLDRTESTLRSAIARYNFMRSKGLNFDKNSLDQFLSLDDVPAAYNQRGAEIHGQLQKSGADPKTIDQQVMRQLKREFGI